MIKSEVLSCLSSPICCCPLIFLTALPLFYSLLSPANPQGTHDGYLSAHADGPASGHSSHSIHPQSPIPPALHSNASGSVVSSWAQGAAAASSAHHHHHQKQYPHMSLGEKADTHACTQSTHTHANHTQPQDDLTGDKLCCFCCASKVEERQMKVPFLTD